jgi:hypothetical protein
MSLTQSFIIFCSFRTDEYLHITPSLAGWESLSFAARKMTARRTLGARDPARTSWRWSSWAGRAASSQPWRVGERRQAFQVFHGMPYTLYLPRRTALHHHSYKRGAGTRLRLGKSARTFPRGWYAQKR